MSLPVMDGHSEEPERKHPENRYRCRPCENGEHDECRVRYTGGKKCACECREALRTKRHDWLDDRFDDEIDLERAMGHAPPTRLVVNASMAGVVTPTAKDAAWFFLGKFKTSPQRPSTADGRWQLSCKRCRGKSKVNTKRLVLTEEPAQLVDWLEERKVFTEAQPERTYRVGRCLKCQTIFWFELTVKK
jgi:hypothetical protein